MTLVRREVQNGVADHVVDSQHDRNALSRQLMSELAVGLEQALRQSHDASPITR